MQPFPHEAWSDRMPVIPFGRFMVRCPQCGSDIVRECDENGDTPPILHDCATKDWAISDRTETP